MKIYIHEEISGVIECDNDRKTQDRIQDLMDVGGIELIQREYNVKITYRDTAVEEL